MTDEFMMCALGHYGKPPAPVDPEVLDRIMSSPRGKELVHWTCPQISFEDLRREIGPGYSEEELLLLILVNEKDLKAMKEAGSIPTEYSAAGRSLLNLIKELSKKKNANYIRIQKDNFSLTLKKNAAA
jgi:oxaloacetate decarboxylase alpha subunit